MKLSSYGIPNQGQVRHTNEDALFIDEWSPRWSPEEACHQLAQIANDNEGPDNITVIVIQIL